MGVSGANTARETIAPIPWHRIIIRRVAGSSPAAATSEGPAPAGPLLRSGGCVRRGDCGPRLTAGTASRGAAPVSGWPLSDQMPQRPGRDTALERKFSALRSAARRGAPVLGLRPPSGAISMSGSRVGAPKASSSTPPGPGLEGPVVSGGHLSASIGPTPPSRRRPSRGRYRLRTT